MKTTLPRPNVLYHYTSAPGFFGIVRKRSLWLTHIRYLNDSAEFTHGVNEAIAHLDTRRFSDHAEERFVAILRERLSALPPLDYFVGSFSEQGDLLSQWRSYSNDATGFSLGFRIEDLYPHLERQGFMLRRCVYHPAEKEDLVSDLLNRALDKSRAGLENDEVLAKVADQFISSFLQVAPAFKDIAFSEETEWRLYIGPLPMTSPRVEFRKSPTMIFPYYDFSLSTPEIPMRLARVIVGPNSHLELSRTSASAFLLKHGIDCEVATSTIPFRSW